MLETRPRTDRMHPAAVGVLLHLPRAASSPWSHSFHRATISAAGSRGMCVALLERLRTPVRRKAEKTMRIRLPITVIPGHDDMTLEDCRGEVRATGGSIPARLRLAAKLVEAGQFEEAVQECTEVRLLLERGGTQHPFAPTQAGPLAHYLAGCALEGLGRRTDARAEWEQAKKQDPYGIGRQAGRMLRELSA